MPMLIRALTTTWALERFKYLYYDFTASNRNF